MNTFIVYVTDPKVKDDLAKVGTVGKPSSLLTVIILKTDRSKQEIEAISGVEAVEEESFDTPTELKIQARPPSWFLPSASNTWPDYYYNKTGDGVTVYVMDSGIRFDHEDFDGRDVETVYSYDGLEYGGNVAGASHGTMAASCAAGNRHGIAKGVKICNARYNWSSIEGIKALDSILAHYRANNAPAVLSMSFGSTSNIYDRIFTQLAEEGIVMVAAAGNYDEPRPMFPALRDDVIAVAACDRDLRPSVWGGATPGTNYGQEVDVWAGGSGGWSADITARNSAQTASGTSSACPLVAGCVALLLEGSKKLSSYQEVLTVKGQLLSQTRKDVIKYTDPKYNTTPNRYIYTLGDIDNPPPAREVPPEKSKNNTVYLIIGAIAVIALLVLVL